MEFVQELVTLLPWEDKVEEYPFDDDEPIDTEEPVIAPEPVAPEPTEEPVAAPEESPSLVSVKPETVKYDLFSMGLLKIGKIPEEPK